MPKTEVILTHNIVGLGGESDHVKVAAGYARNYLFPQGLAVPVTGANKRRLEVLRQRRAEREAHEFNTMSELAKSLAKLTCIVKVKTGDDGKMFGSVTSGTIADELKHQFEISLDKKKIHLENPIRAVGDYQVELRLHHEVTTALKVHVESTTPLQAPAETPDAGKGAPRERREGGPVRTFKRGKRPFPETTAAAKPPAEAAPRAAAKPERGERKPRPAKPEPTEKAN